MCVGCGKHFADGEDYYLIDGQKWCEECINECKETYEEYDPRIDLQIDENIERRLGIA